MTIHEGELRAIVFANEILKSGDGRKIRERAGISLRTMAKVVGVAPISLSRWELGQTKPQVTDALDGVWTPHGLITVMTTNKKKHLDKALIRSGRVDVDEKFTELDEDQAMRLALWFGASVTREFVSEYVGKSPADLIGAMRCD
jgi:predicted transcriptional regulator